MGYRVSQEIRVVLDETCLESLTEHGSIVIRHPTAEGYIRIIYSDEDLEPEPEEPDVLEDRSVR